LKEEFTKRVENSSFHRFASKEQESYKNTGDFLTSDLTSDLTSEIGSDFGSDETRYKKNRFHPPPIGEKEEASTLIKSQKGACILNY